MAEVPNPYQVLGVSEKATPDEIKKAFRKLARELHPDRNPGDVRAEEDFKAATAAHDILSDPEKKQAYDAEMAERLADLEREEAERKQRRKEAEAKGISGMFGGSPPIPKPPPKREAGPKAASQPKEPRPEPASSTAPPKATPSPPPPRPSQSYTPPARQESPPRAQPVQPATSMRRPAGVVAFMVILIVIIVAAHSGGGSTASRQPTPTTETSSQPVTTPTPPTPQPKSVPLPKRASESFDVTPTFESAGGVSKAEYKYNSQELERRLTLDAELEGDLLKVTVNIAYSAAIVREKNESASNHFESPISLTKEVGESCVGAATSNIESQSGNREVVHEINPIAMHLVQHGLDVSGTLLYPVVLPGVYKWGCNEDPSVDIYTPTLGKVTTTNVGVTGKLTVYKIRRAATDTVVLFGGWDHTEHWLSGPRNLTESCIMPEAGASGKAINPSHIKLNHRWLYHQSEGYMQGALAFPVGGADVGDYRFYPECDSEDEGGIPLANSEE
jgi:DnaJ-like protein